MIFITKICHQYVRSVRGSLPCNDKMIRARSPGSKNV